MKNYATHLAKLALHFDVLPTALDPDQINDYLYLVKKEHPTASESYFKFTVYGLRFAFRMLTKSIENNNRINLESLIPTLKEEEMNILNRYGAVKTVYLHK